MCKRFSEPELWKEEHSSYLFIFFGSPLCYDGRSGKHWRMLNVLECESVRVLIYLFIYGSYGAVMLFGQTRLNR